MNYRSHVEKKAQGMAEPKRILFFRGMTSCVVYVQGLMNTLTDGVSEGQFQEVLDKG